MFLIKRPTEKRIADFLRSTETLPFSYTEAGMTAVQPPAGYRVDHNRVILGKGPETFERAATLWGVPRQAIEESPAVLVGTIGQCMELLVERRERYGFSYIHVGSDFENTSEMVARLADR